VHILLVLLTGVSKTFVRCRHREGPTVKRTKLHAAAASNNRDNLTRSLAALLVRATCM